MTRTMRFQLEPDNRGASDEDLLGDLRAVAATIGRSAVGRDEYEKHGRFHPKTLVKRFGSWNATLTKAGLQVLKPHLVSEDEFLADVRRVAALLNSDTLTSEQYLEHGRFSLKLLPRQFGRWQDALDQAGLKPSSAYVRPLSDAELHENMERVWEELGRQPKQSDMRKPLSRVGHDTYTRRFGSWRGALEQFVATVTGVEEEPAAESLTDAHRSGLPVQPAKRGAATRIAGWRLRFLVMRRDHFRCCQCGASPAVSPGTVLVIDHVIPWSQGGLTVLDNLQTLCVPCNGGKSDLQQTA